SRAHHAVLQAGAPHVGHHAHGRGEGGPGPERTKVRAALRGHSPHRRTPPKDSRVQYNPSPMLLFPLWKWRNYAKGFSIFRVAPPTNPSGRYSRPTDHA